MSDPKDEMTIILEENRDQMIMDALLRLTVLENLLMRKGILTDSEIKAEILVLSSAIAQSVSQRLGPILIEPEEVAELEKWVDEFSSSKKKDHNSN